MASRIVVWSATARGELRAIDRETAWNVLQAIDRYLETGAGDAIKLQPPRTEFRLRVGDYRVLFRRIDEQPSRSSASAIAARLTAKPEYRS